MKRLLVISLALLPSWTAAHAQDGADYRVRVGLGAQYRPQFPGAEKDKLAPLWDIDIARGNEPFRFEAPDDSFEIRLVSTADFAAGPVATIAPGRRDSDVGAPLGKVATTVEVGGFAEYYAGKSVRLRGELRQGINGHSGLVGVVGVDKIWRDGDRYVFSIGPRLLYGDGRYQRAYFGVTPAAALASGLPVYRPAGGFRAVALVSGLSYQFNPRFGMFGFARYGRLIGNAEKSPIVRQFGSRDQLSGGIGLSYTFTVRR